MTAEQLAQLADRKAQKDHSRALPASKQKEKARRAARNAQTRRLAREKFEAEGSVGAPPLPPTYGVAALREQLRAAGIFEECSRCGLDSPVAPLAPRRAAPSAAGAQLGESPDARGAAPDRLHVRGQLELSRALHTCTRDVCGLLVFQCSVRSAQAEKVFLRPLTTSACAALISCFPAFKPFETAAPQGRRTALIPLRAAGSLPLSCLLMESKFSLCVSASLQVSDAPSGRHG